MKSIEQIDLELDEAAEVAVLEITEGAPITQILRIMLKRAFVRGALYATAS